MVVTPHIDTSEEPDNPEKKQKGFLQRRTVLSLCILVMVSMAFGMLFFLKPRIVIDPRKPGMGIYVRNEGRLEASIHRVDGFWYWASQVGMLADIPSIRQHVKRDAGAVRLQIPDMPPPDNYGISQGVCYMKLVVRYTIPGVPIFRFETLAYFAYDNEKREWATAEGIPPEHRALGRVPMGNVEVIHLNFP